MASLECVLILWADRPVTPAEIETLLAKAWPGRLPNGLPISTYEVMPNQGMAQAMVAELESQGELSAGSLERMRVVPAGRQRLVVLIEAGSARRGSLVRRLLRWRR
jgi:hypothetical protein